MTDYSFLSKENSRSTEWVKINDHLTSRNISVGRILINESISAVSLKNGTQKYKLLFVAEVWVDTPEQVKLTKGIFDSVINDFKSKIKVEPKPYKWLGYTNFGNKKEKDE